MFEDVIELKGQEPGPVSMILVGVHGNERCGIDAIEELLPSLKIQKGRVLIAYGNPKAIDQNVRYTEANLNRLFKSDEMLSEREKDSCEYSRAQFLKKYLDQADCLLDIHASLTPNSQRFVICEKNAQKITKYLPVSLVVSGFDEVEPGGTDYYMNQQDKIGICIECGYFDDASSKEVAKESIFSFLAICENIAGITKEYSQASVAIKGMHSTKNNFVLTRQFKDFEQVNEGEVIGIDGVEEIKMPFNGVILFARNRNIPNEEAFLYGEYKNKV
jgi:succinylglutamate desuccinylase